MGEYNGVKKNKMIRFLVWLGNHKSHLVVKKCTKHVYSVKYNYWDHPFTVPCGHSTVTPFIVKEFMEKLVGSGICTKEEFDEHVK